jgi:hypothetical protein
LCLAFPKIQKKPTIWLLALSVGSIFNYSPILDIVLVNLTGTITLLGIGSPLKVAGCQLGIALVNLVRLLCSLLE